MKCPHCQAENREGATVCKDCGQPFEFEVVCLQCGSKSPHGVKFCDKCGQSLVEKGPPLTQPSSQPTSFANGRYKVKKFLGEGGKKKVYLAHDTVLDRDVAFALIKTEKLDEVARTRIKREARPRKELDGLLVWVAFINHSFYDLIPINMILSSSCVSLGVTR